MAIVAAYQAPLLPSGTTEAIDLIAAQVRVCESLGVQVLCWPEAVLGGLADYATRSDAIAIEVKRGQFQQVTARIASDTVTTILGFAGIPFAVGLLVADIETRFATITSHLGPLRRRLYET